MKISKGIQLWWFVFTTWKEWSELGNPGLISQQQWYPASLAHKIAKTYRKKAGKMG